MFPTTRPLWKQTRSFRVLFSTSFGISSKGALPTGSPHGDPIERDAPFPEPSFTHLSNFPVYEPLSRFPKIKYDFVMYFRDNA